MPAVVAKRNARERTRVHTVNQAFLLLKQHLPSLRQFTKRVSKLRILNAAINYIEGLLKLIQTSDAMAAKIPKTTIIRPTVECNSDTSLVEYRNSVSFAPIPTVFTTPATNPSTLPYMKTLLDYPSYFYQQPAQPHIISVNNQLVHMPTYQCM